MTDILPLVAKLRRDTEWQQTPDFVGDEDLAEMIASGIEHLYTMQGRSSQIGGDAFTKDDGMIVSFAQDLSVAETRYVMCCAKISFFQKAQTDASFMVSYTTDALSIAHADKPFANLADMISQLKRERDFLFLKMVDHSMM